MKYILFAVLMTINAESSWDKAYVLLTAVLVIIGTVGAALAVKTLRAIRRQGVSMRRQTTILRNSVAVAKAA